MFYNNLPAFAFRKKCHNLIIHSQNQCLMKRKLLSIAMSLVIFTLGIFTSGFILNRKKDMNLLDNKKMAQVAIVVKDIEKSAAAYAELFNVPVPGISVTEEPENKPTMYNGQHSDAKAKLAFFNLDNIQIELIQPVGEPSTWNDFLEKHGEGLHHIAFWVNGMEKHVGLFRQHGMPEVQSGGWESGEYSYIDAGKRLGIVVELLENYNGKEE